MVLMPAALAFCCTAAAEGLSRPSVISTATPSWIIESAMVANFCLVTLRILDVGLDAGILEMPVCSSGLSYWM